MVTISDYYKYAALSAAAYVRMGNVPYDGARLAELASTQSDGRIPFALGQRLFDPRLADPGTPQWTILHYHAGDTGLTPDDTGLGATLFRQEGTGEAVLAVRGVEPALLSEGGDPVQDLLGASIGGIGMLGVAVTQLVELLNLIEQLYAPRTEQVRQVRAELSLERPEAVAGQIVLELQGQTGVAPLAIPVPLFLVLSSYKANGLEKLAPGEKLTLTGHSLGGHLAAVASRIVTQHVNPDVYAFNSPGMDPASWNVAPALLTRRVIYLRMAAEALAGAVKGALAESLGEEALLLATEAQQQGANIINALRILFNAPENATLPTVQNLESEDVVPGNDLSLVASIWTGAQALGKEIPVPVEVNSHSIEQMTDALALHALLYRLNSELTLADITHIVEAAEVVTASSEERVVEILRGLILGDRTRLPISDASSAFDLWAGKGELAARQAYHEALLAIGDAVAKSPVPPRVESLVGRSLEDLGDQRGRGRIFAGDHYLDGNGGDDWLEGSAGAGTLLGGESDDVLVGGGKDQQFEYGAADNDQWRRAA